MGIQTYLLATWHPSTRPQQLDLDVDPFPRWLGLDIRRYRNTGSDTAIVDGHGRWP